MAMHISFYKYVDDSEAHLQIDYPLKTHCYTYFHSHIDSRSRGQIGSARDMDMLGERETV